MPKFRGQLPGFRTLRGLGLCLSLIVLLSASLLVNQVGSSGLTVISPPDATIQGSGTSTKFALGSPIVSGTTDPTPTISQNAPGSIPAPSGAVSYWSFDNGLQDASGNGNKGTASGNAEIRSSYISKALSLDGDRDYVGVADSSSVRLTGAFSISAWVYLNTLSPANGYPRILEKGTSDDGYNMFYNTLAKRIGFGFTTNTVKTELSTVKTDWAAQRWYHVVGTFDPAISQNNMKIYVDSVLNNQLTKTGKLPATTSALIIGATGSSSWEFWNGQIDEVRLYKRALTGTEIKNLYNAPFAKLSAGTNIITWKANDDFGSSATAVQFVSVLSPIIDFPVTSAIANGPKYCASSCDPVYVSAGTTFTFSVTSQDSVKSTYFRYFKEADTFRPAFTVWNHLPFKVIGTAGIVYVLQYYSVDIAGNAEPVKQTKVIIDNLAPTTSINLVNGYAGANLQLSSKENPLGSGIGQLSTSGIYYKLDSAFSYTLVKSSVVKLATVSSGAHKISFYSIDNVGNSEPVKTAYFTKVTFTFCTSGCDYSNLQSAVNALSSSGGKIYIANGKYTMSNTINLKSGTSLQFGSTASIEVTATGIPLFKGSGIKNISINGGSIMATMGEVKAFSFTKSSVIKVTGTTVTLIKGDSSAFECRDCIDVSISNVYFKTASFPIDIRPTASSTNGLSSKIWIQNSKFEDASIIGISVNYSTDVHIIGNTVTNTMDNGIDIGANKNSEVRANTITNGGVPNGVAIHTDGANGADIIGNKISYTTSKKIGIMIFRSSNINAIDNTITKAYDGVNIISANEPSSNILIKSNDILSPYRYGVLESPKQGAVEISYNTIQNSGDDPIVVPVWGNSGTKVIGNIILP